MSKGGRATHTARCILLLLSGVAVVASSEPSGIKCNTTPSNDFWSWWLLHGSIVLARSVVSYCLAVLPEDQRPNG